MFNLISISEDNTKYFLSLKISTLFKIEAFSVTSVLGDLIIWNNC
jgi:hypothetical protein